MRIIDDRGRIFGIINIFDLLVLFLVILMVTPAVIYKCDNTKNENKAKPQEIPNYSQVYKNIKAKEYLISEVVQRIKKGDKAFDRYGNLMWEITGISDEPAILSLADKKDSVPVKVTAISNSTYDFVSQQITMPLGMTFDNVEKTVTISSLRRVEITLKLLCGMDKNGIINISSPEVVVPPHGLELGAGVRIMLKGPGYIALFDITDVL